MKKLHQIFSEAVSEKTSERVGNMNSKISSENAKQMMKTRIAQLSKAIDVEKVSKPTEKYVVLVGSVPVMFDSNSKPTEAASVLQATRFTKEAAAKAAASVKNKMGDKATVALALEVLETELQVYKDMLGNM